MKLIFLGSGSAFTSSGNNWQSNMILETKSGKRLLIDCGGDVRFSLPERGLSVKNIDAIYISHLHADHVGGLEYVAFTTFFTPNLPRPVLFGNDRVLRGLWDNSLKGGLSSLQNMETTLSTYFDSRPIVGEGTFEWEGHSFGLVEVEHVYANTTLTPSFGLRFELGSRKAFLTTDSQFTPERLRPHYEWADVIFHDCETSPFPSTVHPHYKDLLTLPAEIKAKTWLYHYQDGPLPDCVADGFLGFVLKGQVFE